MCVTLSSDQNGEKQERLIFLLHCTRSINLRLCFTVSFHNFFGPPLVTRILITEHTSPLVYRKATIGCVHTTSYVSFSHFHFSHTHITLPSNMLFSDHCLFSSAQTSSRHSHFWENSFVYIYCCSP